MKKYHIRGHHMWHWKWNINQVMGSYINQKRLHQRTNRPNKVPDVVLGSFSRYKPQHALLEMASRGRPSIPVDDIFIELRAKTKKQK